MNCKLDVNLLRVIWSKEIENWIRKRRRNKSWRCNIRKLIKAMLHWRRSMVNLNKELWVLRAQLEVQRISQKLAAVIQTIPRRITWTCGANLDTVASKQDPTMPCLEVKLLFSNKRESKSSKNTPPQAKLESELDLKNFIMTRPSSKSHTLDNEIKRTITDELKVRISYFFKNVY